MQAKGRGDPGASRAVQSWLYECGLGGQKIKLRCDQEPAIIAVAKDVIQARAPAVTLFETTPVGSSDSLAGVNRFAQTLAGCLRALKIETELLWGVFIKTTEAVFPWLVRHSAWTYCRFQPYLGGQPPYNRIHEKPYTGEVLLFGTPVLARYPKATELPKLDERFVQGLWLGKTATADEHIVGTRDGIMTTRTVKVVPVSSVDMSLYTEMTYTPWNPLPVDAQNEFDKVKEASETAARPQELSGAPEVTQPRPMLMPDGDEKPVGGACNRRARTLRSYLADWGATPGCRACRRPGGKIHTPACKRRRTEWQNSRNASLATEQFQAPPVVLPSSATVPAGQAEAKGFGPTSKEGIRYGPYTRKTGKQPDPLRQCNAPERELQPKCDEQLEEKKQQQEEEFAQRMEDEESRKRAREEEFTEVENEEFLSRVLREPEVAVVCGPPWFSETGEQLLEDYVRLGMQDERDSLRSFSVFDEVLVDSVPPEARIIPSRWLFVRKPDAQRPNRVKGRIVAQDVKRRGDFQSVFAACPTVVGQRILLQHAIEMQWEIALGDVSTAFLHAPLLAEEPIYVKPPPEEWMGDKPRVLWKLKRALYGLRSAPKAFQHHLALCLQAQGFRRCKTDPQLYVCDCTPALVSIHADDLLVAAPANKIAEVKARVNKDFKIKWGPLISNEWVRYLGKEFRKTSEAVQVRIPPKYFQTLLQEFRLEHSRPASTPYVAVPQSTGNAEELNAQMHQQFRHAIGKLMWTQYERPDLAFATKELARKVQSPTVGDWKQLIQLLRYVKSTVEFALTLKFDKQAPQNEVQIVTDANWAKTGACRSTSASTVWYRGCLIASFCRTQSVVALSSAEAEFLAAIAGVVEGKLVQSVLNEIGQTANMRLYCDNTAALAIAERTGLGRLKHLDVRHLWIQDEVAAGRLHVEHIDTGENVADLMTKVMSVGRFRTLRRMIGFAETSSPTAGLELHVVEAVLENIWGQVTRRLLDKAAQNAYEVMTSPRDHKRILRRCLKEAELRCGDLSENCRRCHGDQSGPCVVMLECYEDVMAECLSRQAPSRPVPRFHFPTQPNDGQVCVIMTLEEENPAPRCICHRFMTLRLSYAGQAFWECENCQRQATWQQYKRSQGLGTPVPTYIPKLAPSDAHVEIKPKSKARAKVQASTASTSAMVSAATVVNVTSSTERRPDLQPEVADSHGQTGPTARQRDYLARLLLQRGCDPQPVLARLQTKAEVSHAISRLLAGCLP